MHTERVDNSQNLQCPFRGVHQFRETENVEVEHKMLFHKAGVSLFPPAKPIANPFSKRQQVTTQVHEGQDHHAACFG